MSNCLLRTLRTVPKITLQHMVLQYRIMRSVMEHLLRGFYHSLKLLHFLVPMSVTQLLFPVLHTSLLCAPHQSSLPQTLDMRLVSFTQSTLILIHRASVNRNNLSQRPLVSQYNLSHRSVVNQYIVSPSTMLIQKPQSLTLNSVL